MRHRNGGFKAVGRNTSVIDGHLLRCNLVPSISLNDRVHTTITTAKATRPIVEKMITLGKNGSVHARRRGSRVHDDARVGRPPVQDRCPALRGTQRRLQPHLLRTGVRKGDASEMAYIELLGAEQELSEKAAKREENRAKKREELQKQLEERAPGEDSDPSATA